MTTFRHLPFQFQQRGPALADAIKDPRLLAQFTESRDQDLEDYLAGLGGGASIAAWTASAVVGGGVDILAPASAVPDWGAASAYGKFTVSGTAATYTGAGNVVVAQFQTTIIDPSASTQSGLVRLSTPGSSDTHLFSVDTAVPTTEGCVDTVVTAFGPGLTIDPAAAPAPLVATPTNMGIAGLTGPDSVSLQVIQFIAVVWPMD